MKILNIHFKNINSLEGESRINFEQPPFSDTGVFAITGPNGSGKSSVLDAITLALYGETFRFNRPAEHVMTQNTQECFSVLEFTVDNEKYQSSWRAQRSNTDDRTIVSDMHLLHSVTGEKLATNPQQVCTRISEITGMNFRNFTRSVLLAQGDFAAFLNALDNERMDILEKIIGTDIYSDYKNNLINQVNQAQKRLNHLEQDLDAIPLLAPERQEALSHDLADFLEQQSELQQEQKNLEQQQQGLTKANDLQKRIAEQEKELETLGNQAQAIQKKIDQLAHSQEALQLKDDIEALQNKQQSLLDNRTSLTSLQAELKLLQQELATATPLDNNTDIPDSLSFADQIKSIDRVRSQMGLLNANKQAANDLWKSLETQIADKQATLTATSSWLQEHTGDAVLLEQFPELATLKNIRITLADLEGQQKSLEQWSKKTASSLKSNTSTHQKSSQKAQELQRKLAEAEKKLANLAEGRSVQEIDELFKDQQERVKDYQRLNQLAEENQTLISGNKSFFGLFKTKETPDYDIDAIQQKLDTLKKEIKLEENIKLALDEAVFQNNLLKKMTADRNHLIDGKPCPLCGSNNHPYIARPPTPSNAERALHDQKEKLHGLEATVVRQEHLLSAAQKAAEKNRIKNEQQQKIQGQWLTLATKLNNASGDTDINNIRLIKQLLAEETQELKNIGTLANEYRDTQKTIDKLKDLISKTESHIETLQTDTQTLDSTWQERHKERSELDATYAQQQQNERALAETVSNQLSALGEKLPGAGKEDAVLDQLNSRRQDYHTYLLRQKSLTEEIGILKAKQNHCKIESDSYDTQLAPLQLQLKKEENVGLHLALVEKQKLIADTEQRIAQYDTESQSLQQLLKEKMQTTALTTLHDVNVVLQLIERQSEIEQQKAELDQIITTKTLELDKNKAQWTIDAAAVDLAIDSEELEAKLWRTLEKLQIATSEAQRAESLLSDQALLQKKYDGVLAQLHTQQAVVQQLVDDSAQIEAENGMLFRRRVQKQLIDQLLAQTNATLEKISGRYYLRQKLNDQGLALEIEDTYQGNIRRLPKTLSGGESFIVSLALALGLSDLANNGRAVDSLFIDEGFGNLDAETLYTVISTLENLQAHGKTVGVISHVESVQKRFKAQLQIVKKPNGMGMLKKAS